MKIEKTKDYKKFKSMLGNRDVNLFHVKRLKISLAEKDLSIYQPILINENFEIIDGQHRFNALKELNKEIHYIIGSNLNIEDVKRLNINNNNWNYDDYMNSYIESGNENYFNYKQFKQHFNLGHPFAITLFQGLGDERKTKFDLFKSGHLVCPDIDKAAEVAEAYYSYSKYVPNWKRKDFYRAFWIVYNNENYDHNQMLRKLEMRSEYILEQHLTDVRSYVLLLEDIFNYKERGDWIHFYNTNK